MTIRRLMNSVFVLYYAFKFLPKKEEKFASQYWNHLFQLIKIEFLDQKFFFSYTHHDESLSFLNEIMKL